MQSSEFNLGAHYYNKDNNEIYVGGINGINIFNPRHVPQLDVPGDLTFTSLKVKNEEINPVTHKDIIYRIVCKNFSCFIKAKYATIGS